MDDVKVLFYLLIGAIWILSKVLKKKDKPEAPTFSGPPDVPPRPGKGLTFEELLAEISQEKVESKPVTTRTSGGWTNPRSEEEDLEVIEEEERDYETAPSRPVTPVYNSNYKDSTGLAYDQAKLEAFNRKSLEEELLQERKEIVYGRFREFAHEVKPGKLQVFVKDLKDREGLRKAFVLNEVLGRKF